MMLERSVRLFQIIANLPSSLLKPYNIRVKRVALIRNSRSYDFGGAELFPINLAHELEKLEYVPVIISAHEKTLSTAQDSGLKVAKGLWWSFQDFSGFKIALLPLYLAWTLVLISWYVVFFLKNRIDVAHPQSRDDFLSTTIAAKLLKRKVVWTDHADLKHIYMNHRKWYKNPVGKLVYLTSKFADKVTIESFSESDLIKKSLGKKLPENYTIVHIGVVDLYRPIDRIDKGMVFISTSRLVKDKGIRELIEAFKLVEAKDVLLRLCGDGPDADYFKTLASGVQNIEFLGHVNNVTEMLQKSDVLVHPTYHESFGLSLVEAEMCNLPIIASGVGSIPEIVEDGVSGILVRPKSVTDLANAMRQLIKNPKQRTDMGKAGRQIYLSKFQFDKIVKEKFVPIYEQA